MIDELLGDIIHELQTLNAQMEILVKEHLRHFDEWRKSDERRNKKATG